MLLYYRYQHAKESSILIFPLTKEGRQRKLNTSFNSAIFEQRNVSLTETNKPYKT